MHLYRPTMKEFFTREFPRRFTERARSFLGTDSVSRSFRAVSAKLSKLIVVRSITFFVR